MKGIQMSPDIDALIAIARLSAILMGIVIISGAAISIAGLMRAPEAFSKVIFALIQSGSLIRMATALVIVAAIVGLRVLDKVSGEASIAALSGIAGYVLGGVRSPSQIRQETSTLPPQSN
jgi:hypothetical protein